MNRIRNDFSQVVGAYEKYRLDYPAKTYDLIYKFCPDKNTSVLDIGCGTGIVTRHLHEFYNTITGTDKEAEMIEVAKSIGPEEIDYREASAEKLPLEDNTLDLVTAGAAYHWFDYDVAGKEIYRVLKENGKMCVFWKYNRDGKAKNYLPLFAHNNLLKFISEVPKSNKGPITGSTFLNVGFKNVKNDEFDFDEIYTKEGILGYIQSHSTFNLLDNNQKKEYLKLNSEIVGEFLTEKKYIFKGRMTMWFVSK